MEVARATVWLSTQHRWNLPHWDSYVRWKIDTNPIIDCGFQFCCVCELHNFDDRANNSETRGIHIWQKQKKWVRFSCGVFRRLIVCTTSLLSKRAERTLKTTGRSSDREVEIYILIHIHFLQASVVSRFDGLLVLFVNFSHSAENYDFAILFRASCHREMTLRRIYFGSIQPSSIRWDILNYFLC